jgi:general secretion pathway protein F
VTVFARELLTLLDAGVPVDRALGIVVETGAAPALNKIVRELQTRVRAGAALSEAMAEHPAAFDSFFCAMVRAGEAGGSLEAALGQLADYRERTESMVASVRTALIYPTILLAAAIVSVTIIMTVVVPEFELIFSEFATKLPWGTKALLGLSGFLREFGWAVFLVMVVAGFAVKRSGVAAIRGSFWLRLPVLGDLIAKIYVERIIRALSALLANGVPLADALRLSAGVAGSTVFARTIAAAETRIKHGDTLADAFGGAPYFPPLVLQLVRVGEESGRLQPVLQKLAAALAAQIDTALKRLIAVLEPCLIIFAGLVVAFIVLSLFGAILSINTHVL